jgi:HSP20 family molecular chaperone IbpA
LTNEHKSLIARSAKAHRDEQLRNEVFYRKNLNSQRLEFEDTFEKTQNQQEITLREKHAQLVNAILRQKKSTLQHAGKYLDRAQDPFYNLASPSTKLHELPNYYVIETQVPEHERDNFDIRVKGDKAIVTGKRAYADEVKDPDRNISTNSYQTFREEIPLAKPVVPKLAEKVYENGVLRVKVPKIG